jgi:HemY protein
MVMLTAQALKAADEAGRLAGDERRREMEMALRQAMLAVALDPCFAPAVALAARLNGALGHVRKGAKLIETAWAEAPHPELADAYMGLIEGESAYDRFKRVQILAGRNRNHMESRVALARAAIGARDWLAARGALETFIGEGASARPTQRICELMAEIEEGEFGNRGSAREWLARALHAPEDAAWSGEGWRSYTWTPINPLTGEFDALTWREPGLRIAGAGLPFEAVSAAVGSDADAGPAVDDMADSAAPDDETPPLQKIGEETDAEAEAVFPPHLPDDPGPDGVDDPDDAPGEGAGDRRW